MAESMRGPWDRSQVADFLMATTVPVRLACNGGRGHPVLASLWFLYEEGRLWCATQADARLARLLGADPRCAFEVSLETPPYRGVRGQGRAELLEDRGAALLDRLLTRYGVDPGSSFADWLRGRAEHEVAIAIEPDSLVSWDYGRRMAAAVEGGDGA